MKKFTLILLFIYSIANFSLSQEYYFDDFSKKALSDWYPYGINMTYSLSEDSKEGGYGILKVDNVLKPGITIGSLLKVKSFLFYPNTFISLMMLGVNNDVNVTLEILYDVDNNSQYNDDQDIKLVSPVFNLNFKDWKQIKLKLSDSTFKLVSQHPEDDYSIMESSAYGIRLIFETGKNYKESKFESGLALISEIFPQNLDNTIRHDKKDSYFNAKNYPNPFNPLTKITYTIPESTSVKITVYDRIGLEVATIVDQNQEPGNYSVEFNATGLKPGTYFYRIKTSTHTEVFKMVFEE